MKIALYIRHQGLLMMLLDLWEDHEVRVFPDWSRREELEISMICDDEDIIVMTIPHHELNWLNTEKPVIAYMTNPIYHTARPGFEFWAARKNFVVVSGEDCHPPEPFLSVTAYIPYAMKDYPLYNGRINKVLVVNRKPNERLMAATRGALGEVYDVAAIMDDLPHTIAAESSIEKFRQMYADYKVLFYFSNSAYTIVMFEAMTVGVPVVAYNAIAYGLTSVVERYFPKRSVYPNEIRRMLKEELDRTPPCSPIDYGNPSFGEVKQMWNDLFEVIA